MQTFKVSIWSIGSANCPLTLKKDKTFLIVNASNSDQPGTHCSLLARADGQVYFADPLGQKLTSYPNENKYTRPSWVYMTVKQIKYWWTDLFNQKTQFYVDFKVITLPIW